MRRLLVASTFCAVSAMAASMTGYISDAHCGAKHSAEKPNAACAKKCVEGGADPVFVSEGKVYKISSDSKDKVTSHVGEKVKVDGSVSGDTITVESVEAGS